MNSKNIVKEIMKQRGHTNASLANKLGFATSSGVSERLRGTTEMRVDTLINLLTAMDCELVIRSKVGDKEKWVVSLDENQ